MNRITAVLLVLVLLLAGCANASPTASETSPTAPNPSDPPSIPDVTVPPREAPFLEDPLWQLPKGQDYYFLFSPRETQYNLNENIGIILITIPLISREKIDLDQFQLTIPLKNVTYEVRKERVRLPPEIDLNLFYAYHNWDWAEYLLAKEIESAVITGKPVSEADQALLNAYDPVILELNNQLMHLTRDDFPGSLSNFYAYQITLCFSYDEQTPEESFSYMDISWPGVSFRHDCGCISFVRKPATEMGSFYWMNQSSGFGKTNSESWLNRKYQYSPFWICMFEPAKDLTLESVSFPDGNGTFLKAYLTMKQEDGTSMNLTWDGKTPLPVQAGTKVEMRVAFADSRTAHLVPTGESWRQLHFSCEGKNYVETCGGYINCSDYDYYALAALYFDNIDIPAYYRDYFSYRSLW